MVQLGKNTSQSLIYLEKNKNEYIYIYIEGTNGFLCQTTEKFNNSPKTSEEQTRNTTI